MSAQDKLNKQELAADLRQLVQHAIAVAREDTGAEPSASLSGREEDEIYAAIDRFAASPTAISQPTYIPADWLKPGAIVPVSSETVALLLRAVREMCLAKATGEST